MNQNTIGCYTKTQNPKPKTSRSLSTLLFVLVLGSSTLFANPALAQSNQPMRAVATCDQREIMMLQERIQELTRLINLLSNELRLFPNRKDEIVAKLIKASEEKCQAETDLYKCMGIPFDACRK